MVIGLDGLLIEIHLLIREFLSTKCVISKRLIKTAKRVPHCRSMLKRNSGDIRAILDDTRAQVLCYRFDLFAA